MKNWFLNLNIYLVSKWIGIFGACAVGVSIAIGMMKNQYMQGYSDGVAATVALIPKKAPRQLDTVYIDTLEGRWKI